MKHIIIPVGCGPAIVQADLSFDDVRAIIGGSVDVVHLTADEAGSLDLYVHEEGKIIGLPPNVKTETGLMLAGTLVATRCDHDGSTVDTSVNDLAVVRGFLATCERPHRFEYDLRDVGTVYAAEPNEDLEQFRARVHRTMAGKPPRGILGVEGVKISRAYAAHLAKRVKRAGPDEVDDIVAELLEVTR